MFGIFKSKERKIKEKELKALKKQIRKEEAKQLTDNAKRCRKFKATCKCYPVLIDEVDKEFKVHVTPARANVFDYEDLVRYRIIKELHPHNTKEVTRLAIEFTLNDCTYYADFLEKPIKIDSFKFSVVESSVKKVTDILDTIV